MNISIDLKLKLKLKLNYQLLKSREQSKLWFVFISIYLNSTIIKSIILPLLGQSFHQYFFLIHHHHSLWPLYFTSEQCQQHDPLWSCYLDVGTVMTAEFSLSLSEDMSSASAQASPIHFAILVLQLASVVTKACPWSHSSSASISSNRSLYIARDGEQIDGRGQVVDTRVLVNRYIIFLRHLAYPL